METKETVVNHLSFSSSSQTFSSRFRILTIDGGLLSFEDYQYGQSIYAVITNPKAAKFVTSREPFHRLIESTHIRLTNNQIHLLKTKTSIFSGFLYFRNSQLKMSMSQLMVNTLVLLFNQKTMRIYLYYHGIQVYIRMKKFTKYLSR